ncbi:YeiH family protein [Novispirillum itersonii]|uniref:YeiH family protein n=1 Tax=Novispirillum itersonii TaxID=189 RepID=UPI000373C674|nr:putative sulfate exporter family transporter [Novispirillum itersonii]
MLPLSVIPPFVADRTGWLLALALGGLALAGNAAATAAGLFIGGPLALALILGLLVRWRWPGAGALPGLPGWGRFTLRAGVAVLGLGVTVQDAARIGWGGVAAVAATLAVTLAVTLLAGRWLKVPPGLTRLIAAGTAVCGASAVLAVAARHQQDEATASHAAVAIAIVTLFGSVGMMLHPALSGWLHLSAVQAGLWAGASLHEVAHAVGAAVQQGPVAADFGTIAKLERVALLVPVVALLGDGKRGTPPLFLLVFVGFMGLASFGLVPPAVQALARPVSLALLTTALAALGVSTALGPLRQAGWRPVALGLIATLVIFLFSFGLIRGFLSV